MSAEFQPKQGMSTKKKWMIGCGGCLGVIIIGAIALAVLGSMGVNALKEASGSSVKEIFGASYKPEAEGYMAFGLPLKQGKFRSMAMMINGNRKLSVVAIDIDNLSDKPLLKSGQQELKKTIDTSDANERRNFLLVFEGALKQVSREIINSSRSGSSKIDDIQFQSTQFLSLDKSKLLPVGNAVVETSQRGKIFYSPSVVAMAPEMDKTGNHVVCLVVTNLNSVSEDPNTDFSEAQKSLREEVLSIVKNSELDDRLTLQGS